MAPLMSVELKKVVVGLPDEAHTALRVVAEINGQDLGETVREIVIEKLFGKMHGVKLAAARFARAIKPVNGG